VLLGLIIPAMGVAQSARINITSGYLNIGVAGGGTASSRTYIVIDNPASTALSASGSSGILPSGEFNVVQWNIGASVAASVYTLPFVADNLTSIPLTVTISSAGTNSVAGQNGSIEFSTWHTQADNYNGTHSIDGLPEDCNNMNSMYTGWGLPTDADNSYRVIDRFWVIDMDYHDLTTHLHSSSSYTFSTPPSFTSIAFTYLGTSNSTSEVNSPNVLTDGSLLAQTFNSSLNTWTVFNPTSDVAGGNTSVLTTGSVTPANFYRDWTLSNMTYPLPVKLLDFTVQCQNFSAVLNWSTATEQNSNYFTIERTEDGINYEPVGQVKAVGNSSTTNHYSAIDDNPPSVTSYYRLSETDMDGHTENIGTVTFSPCANGTTINAFNTTNYINVQINSAESSSSDYTIILYNALGQRVINETRAVANGYNEYTLYTNVAQGVYFLTISNGIRVYTKKIYIN